MWVEEDQNQVLRSMVEDRSLCSLGVHACPTMQCSSRVVTKPVQHTASILGPLPLVPLMANHHNESGPRLGTTCKYPRREELLLFCMFLHDCKGGLVYGTRARIGQTA